MINDRWLSADEIAEYLSVSKETIYIWIEKKNMPCIKAGRAWRFKRLKVDEWLESGKASE